MQVAVLGAGSLGSLVGGVLAIDHNITLVGREPHVTPVRSESLRVLGTESFVAHTEATTEDEGVAADPALVTTKAFDTCAAAAALATGAVDTVLSLGNGLCYEVMPAERLTDTVVGGTTALGATLVSPERVVWLGRGETVA
jgi:2-dehydropantoate 2-reductase